MGVPKFFRYISERYPCLSEFVNEYQIPIFDNLYLDMNGIIHMCSHPDDNNPHFRITEEKIFKDIFHYIEVLFCMIKPQKVFFMAVDGVAPRAKMNQQRGRRFRSAKDAEKSEKEAIKKGETLPDVERFDSNCITPGTEFMDRLHQQLKYFVVHKISSDKMWKKCKVILSGHETPGEGEHKIMDYIRYIRSQHGYDPNTRHCLYGLDADLIMLGLCTHDPHFSLLREEVKFGRKAKRSSVPEEIRFYLLHLSLMREYLELEFASLKLTLKNSAQPKFDIEKIIDDWILMGFLVGNDFIPNLPNLHIANGALPVLYKAYIDVLPTLDGYINEAGTLNLERFEKFMRKLADIDVKNFEETFDDMLYMEAKTGRKQTFHSPLHTNPPVENSGNTDGHNHVRDPALAALISATEELDVTSDDESDKLSSEEEAFKSFKDEYYRNKMEFQKVTPAVMREQAEGYVRAIQWNLNYYYNGVCSWSWFYPHHYSPYISDIKGFANLKIDFELGEPFKPYEQLLAVLPTASKNLLPQCYHHLMTDENSIIKSYYPEDFQTDLNGKRQEWEAVVLVPFIDEKILLDAMKTCNDLLTPDEVRRNQHGPMLVYEYTIEDLGMYKAPDYFPSVLNRAHCTPIDIEEIRVPKEKLVKGAYPGALFNIFYPGFPTMKHLKYESEMKKAKVKVFEMPSRNENMILKILPNELYFNDSLPLDLLGRSIWVRWPHLVEARVVAISNIKQKYIFCESGNNCKTEEKTQFESELQGVTQLYRDRMGIDFGKTEVLVHVQLMTGRKYIFTSGTRVTLEKQFSEVISHYPLQSIVCNIKVHDDCHSTFEDIADIFPEGSLCFAFAYPHYGSQGTILDSKETMKNNELKVLLKITKEPDFTETQRKEGNMRNEYLNLTNAARQLDLSNYVFSRVTGSLLILATNSEGLLKPVNIGLDLKFNKKNLETPGYTKKSESGVWLYTQNTVDLIRNYIEKFPEIFHYLRSSDEDDLMADAVFKTDSEEKIKSIQTWLKTLPIHSIERRVCGSTILEPELIAEIENTVDQLPQSSKDFIMNIKPQFLYKAGLQSGNLCPDPMVTTKLFDRIVNVREGFTVPLGLRGTIVGIHKASNSAINIEGDMYDIVFDQTFVGGLALNCSEHRGYRLPNNSFINITHGKRQMEQKTGAPGALRALAKDRHTVHNYTANSGNGNMTPRKQNSAFASFSNKMSPNLMSSFSKGLQHNVTPHQLRTHRENTIRDQNNMKNSFHYMADFSQTYDLKINKENSISRNIASVNHRSNQQMTKGHASATQKSVTAKPRAEVNTDFLKRILNIPSSPGNSTVQGTQQGDTTRSHSKSFNSRQQTLNSTRAATAQLLSYYQSNLLGCPRYTYLEEEAGFRAQVALPNGKIICGNIAKSREDASENVALDALKILPSEYKSTNESLPPQFPVPPTKWVQQRQLHNKMSLQAFNNNQQMNQHPRMSFNTRDGKICPETNTNKAHSALAHHTRISTNSHTADFVPLQALKKKQNKSISYVNRNLNVNLQSIKLEGNHALKSTKKTTDVSKVHEADVRERLEKTKRHRKTRIAANFNK